MKKLILLCGSYLACLIGNAQSVGINEDGSAPNASVILDIKSTDKGILIPRTDTNTVSNAGNLVTGSLIFQNTDNSFYYYDGSRWEAIGGTQTMSDDQTISLINDTLYLEDGGFVDLSVYTRFSHRIEDQDGDTSIDTDPSLNDPDAIAICIGGTPKYRLEHNRIAILDSTNNTHIGEHAGDSGIMNTFVGNTAGPNCSGYFNTAIGAGAALSLTNGYYNTFVGYECGMDIRGSRNTALGGTALWMTQTGNSNVAIGWGAGGELQQGDRNVMIGYYAGPPTYRSLNDRLYVDVTSTNSPLIYGEFDNNLIRINGELQSTGSLGVGTTAPDSKLHVVTGGGSPLSFRVKSDGVHINDYALPPTDGTNSQVLTTNGSGQVSWQDPPQLINTDEQALTIDNGNANLSISNGNSVRLSSILDQDSNTGIRVEESLDDNTIRFDIQGSEAMMISEFGQVGIADTDPTEGLLTVGGVSNTAYQAHSAHRYGHGGNQVANTSSSYSIWASGRISAHAFHARSDARIKSVKGVSDSSSDLQKLMTLEVTDYSMIDTIASGSKQHKKLIAQQVDKVYPQAVNKSSRAAIPDIYQIAEIKNGKIQLPTDLRVGDHIKIIQEEDSYEVEVLDVEEQSFTIDSNHEGSVFVYGTYVDDLHTVDYEAISMLNVSATQELVNRNKSLQSRLVETQCAMAELRAINDKMGNRLKRIESMLGVDEEHDVTVIPSGTK